SRPRVRLAPWGTPGHHVPVIHLQLKIGVWSHGRQRAYLTSKATAGIMLTLVDQAYTSQTCSGTRPDGPACLPAHTPEGRRCRCPVCGCTAHQDAVGAATPLCLASSGAPGHLLPPPPT